MDKEKWRQISTIDLDQLEDGTEIIWERRFYTYEEVKKETMVKGKKKIKKEQRITGFRYEAYRTILSKYHHKTVSGYFPCLVSAPDGEFPYMTPWLDDWIYAFNGAFEQMYVRRKEND